MLSVHNLAVDCRDARRVAAFWAAALQHESEVGEGYAFVFPQGWKAGDAAVRLLFQEVPEPKAVKNRVHLDVRAEDMSAEVARLTRLGATPLRVVDEEHVSWTVMADPEGNEFCVAHIPLE